MEFAVASSVTNVNFPNFNPWLSSHIIIKVITIIIIIIIIIIIKPVQKWTEILNWNDICDLQTTLKYSTVTYEVLAFRRCASFLTDSSLTAKIKKKRDSLVWQQHLHPETWSEDSSSAELENVILCFSFTISKLSVLDTFFFFFTFSDECKMKHLCQCCLSISLFPHWD